jgi:hypothetical protein
LNFSELFREQITDINYNKIEYDKTIIRDRDERLCPKYKFIKTEHIFFVRNTEYLKYTYEPEDLIKNQVKKC